MKILYFSLLFLVLNSCNPFDLDAAESRQKPPKRGIRDFPKVKPISDLKEKLEKVKKPTNCTQYKNSNSFSILGRFSLSKPIQNCLAQALDESLKPICEHERDLKNALKHYERQRDKAQIEEIELQLPRG